MKIVIDIPDENYKKDNLLHFFGCYSEKLDEVIKNGTPLPKTNGEVIKAMFKPYTIDEDFDSYYTFGTIEDWNSGKWCTFPKDWWKAPYNGDKE